MIRSLVVLSFVLLSVIPASASWVRIPEKALLGGAELVVVGTLGEAELVAEDASGRSVNRTYRAAIEVDEVLMGDAGESPVIEWRIHGVLKEDGTLARLSTSYEFDRNEGEKGIWILPYRSRCETAFKVGYPGVFVRLAEKDSIESLLREPLYRLQLEKREYAAGEPVSATLTFRSAKGSLELGDWVRDEGNYLLFSGDLKVSVVKDSFELYQLTATQRAEHRATEAGHVVTKPDSPYVFTMVLSDYFLLDEPDVYSVWFGNSEEDSSNRAHFYRRKPAED